MIDFPYSRAVVTGAAGFIGSHLTEELLHLGVEVVALDDFSAGKEENLAHLAPFTEAGQLIVARHDVTVVDGLVELFQGVDIVFHNAASKKTVSLNNPSRDLAVNAGGTLNVLRAASQCGVRKVVHASTGSVYGEPQYLPQDEAHPLRPVSVYGISKLAAENYALLFERMYGLNTSVIRYFHVYGPRQEYSNKGGVIPIFIRRILKDQPPVIFGDGTQLRCFTYVKDVVQANLLIATHPDSRGQVYNCASDLRVTINELTGRLLRLMHADGLAPIYGDWTAGDIKMFDVDNRKIKSLGMRFQDDFDSGLLTVVDWLSEKKRKGELGIEFGTPEPTAPQTPTKISELNP